MNSTYSTDFEFYWVKPNELAGSSRPTSATHIKKIINEGIRHVVSLASAAAIKKKFASYPFVQHLSLEFEDFGVPSMTQLKTFIDFARKSRLNKEPLLIHCAMGCGRTGVLLTIYLMVFDNLSKESALQQIRSIRPCAVETTRQEIFLEQLNIGQLK